MMFQRLLLLTLIASVLTACGGDDYDGEDLINRGNPFATPDDGGDDTDDGDDDDGGDDGDGDTVGGDTDDGDTDDGDTGGETPAECADAVVYTFETQEDVDAWFINAGGTDLQLELNAEGDGTGMAIVPLQWNSATNNWERQARTSLDSPMDLRGATVTYVFDMPQEYIDDGDLVLQFPVQGESGDHWGDYVNVNTLSAEGNEIELAFASDDDTADALSHFGMQFTEIPGDSTILAPFVLHSMTITPASCSGEPALEGDVVFDFSTGDHGANNDNSDVTISHDSDAGVLVLTPDWVAADNVKFIVVASDIVMADMVGATIEYVVDIPQVYVDAGLQVQGFVQENSGNYDMNFGTIHNASAGENTYTFSPDPSSPLNGPEDLEGEPRIGLQLVGSGVTDDVTDEIHVKAIIVTFAD